MYKFRFFFTSNLWLNIKLSYIISDQSFNILHKYAMDNHYTKRQPFRLETHRERAILSIGVHLAPPGDLSLIRYPVSYRVKFIILRIRGLLMELINFRYLWFFSFDFSSPLKSFRSRATFFVKSWVVTGYLINDKSPGGAKWTPVDKMARSWQFAT